MYHCHSEYSLLDSCTKYQDYVDLAVRDKAPALSISEHGKPLNWTEKWAACKAAGLRYIHSVEIYLTESHAEKVRDNFHTVLMARNYDGLLELNEAVARSCEKDHFYYNNRLSFDEFLALSPNIIATSACLASPLNRLPVDHPRFYELAKRYDFLEIQPHSHPDQVLFNRRLWEIHKTLGIPLIAGTDTHSSSKYKAECRAVLLSSKHKSYGDEDAFDLSYKTYDELVDMFDRQDAMPRQDFIEALDNTNALYDLTEDIDLDTSIKYPVLHGSRETDREHFTQRVEEMFRTKCESGVIPKEQQPAFRSAIDEEMKVFRKLNMEGFMLSMSELIGWCKSQGMAIGTARGSVGGSRVAYVTDIIDLNPEQWHTVFSRFCNENREEIGDIDIDCVESDRPAIFRHIVSRFGGDKTARVASFGTMQSKGVIDDVGRHLAMKWDEAHKTGAVEYDTHEGRFFDKKPADNPWSLKNIARIKGEFDADPEKTKQKYPELFYYYDGLVDTKISQSVHPAGIVISPITLPDHYGVFEKDGESCLMLDMENIHDFTGLAKYDFLILKTVQVIRDTCRYLDKPYPKTYEIDWNDQDVWADMLKSPVGIFQMEGSYAHESLRKFRPTSIFDMSLVTAAIRPSGASYRDDLLARRPHSNPSELIDTLLSNNMGYLVYQEDIIAFLQNICGLSGSEADTVRRGIARKKPEILQKSMPHILDGYCSRSDHPREQAEKECQEFLKIIEDASSYMFGYNHSIAYCLLGYLCAYYRYYHPLEFLTAFLNCAANDDDVKNGTAYASKIGVRITMPKFGVSRSVYSYDSERRIIAKGLASVKYMSDSVSEELYQLAQSRRYDFFVDLLSDIDKNTSLNVRQLDILIKLDFFSDFGNQRELLKICEIFYDTFNKGCAKKISRQKIEGTPLESIVSKYAVGETKSGSVAKSYTLLDVDSILREAEAAVRSSGMQDMPDTVKVRNFAEIMGYAGYVSGREEDRRKLYVMDIFPVNRKKDGKQFGYSIATKSIGSGVESRFTVFNRVFQTDPIKKGDIIYCSSYERDGVYYTLTGFRKINDDAIAS